MMNRFLKTNRRWGSEDDKHFGPFTFSSTGSYKGYGIVFDSGDPQEGEPEAHVRIRFRTATLIMELPNWLVPTGLNQIVPDGDWYDWETNYGVMVWVDQHPAVTSYYGIQTGDSSSEKSNYWSIPWLNRRFHRHSILDPDHNIVWTQYAKDRKDWKDAHEAEESVEKVKFYCRDKYDNAEIIATCHISEREWRHGTGWFKWLSYFTKPTIQRSLSIEYDQEVGPRKGSWKGGIMGTGCKIEPGEKPWIAFRKHCIANNLDYIGEI